MSRLKNILKPEQPTQMLLKISQNIKEEVPIWLQTFAVKGGVQNDLQSSVVVNASHTREAKQITMSPNLLMIEL